MSKLDRTICIFSMPWHRPYDVIAGHTKLTSFWTSRLCLGRGVHSGDICSPCCKSRPGTCIRKRAVREACARPSTHMRCRACASATHAVCEADHVGDDAPRAVHLGAVAGIEDQHQVEVAIAGVAHQRGQKPRLLRSAHPLLPDGAQRCGLWRGSGGGLASTSGRRKCISEMSRYEALVGDSHFMRRCRQHILSSVIFRTAPSLGLGT